MDRLQTIIQQMISVRGGTVPEEEMKRIVETAKRLSPLSRRHHYIPQFFIRGFTNFQGFIYKYDKTNDRISKKALSPESVFFEKDRNSFSKDGVPISVIEDRFYSILDDEFARKLQPVLTDNITDLVDKADINAFLTAFLINLFWRNPVADYAFERLFQESKITFTDSKVGQKTENTKREQELKNAPFYFKMKKAAMFSTAIHKIIEENRRDGMFHQFWHFEPDTFLLGDYPILFRHVPSTYSDLMHMDYFFPLSSSRLYSIHKKKAMSVDKREIQLINALVIDQAKHTVVCGDYEYLKYSVGLWKMLLKDFPLLLFKERLFDENRP
jgi:hypothetical protein